MNDLTWWGLAAGATSPMKSRVNDKNLTERSAAAEET